MTKNPKLIELLAVSFELRASNGAGQIINAVFVDRRCHR